MPLVNNWSWFMHGFNTIWMIWNFEGILYSYISVPPNTGNSGSRSSHIYWIYVRSLTLHIYWIQEVGLCIVIEYMESDSSYSLNTGSRSPHIQLNTGSRYPQICWIQEVSLCLVFEYMESDYAYSIKYRESDSA